LKRPKKAKVVKEYTRATITEIDCPHCRTTMRGSIDCYVDRIRCWHCDNPIILIW
jgi:hypothetical protein